MTTIRLAVAQSKTLSSTSATLSALSETASAAAGQSVDLILFPEAYLGGYPRGADFGSAVGTRRADGREQFLNYFKEAIDLGDGPVEGGEKWVKREGGVRGDGTREELERISRESGIFLVVGVVERAGGSLYCSVVYVEPRRGCIGKRRKVMPVSLQL
jgi:nitrilase